MGQCIGAPVINFIKIRGYMNKKDTAMINNDLRYEYCPLCTSGNIQSVRGKFIPYESPLFFSSAEIYLEHRPELWRCTSCRSAFVQNIIPEVTAISLYSISAASERWSCEPFEKVKPRIIVETLKKILKKDMSVLDIGCNTGQFLDFARKRGCKTAGVEVSNTSREIVEKKGHVCLPLLNKVSEKYDVITAFDFIEHSYNIPEFLNACNEKLSQGGRLVILTGNISTMTAYLLGHMWWYVTFPEHIVFPSRKYFKSFSNFRVDSFIRTFASVDFESSILERCMTLGRCFLKRILGYQGLPSPEPDHMFLVLKKVY